MKTSTWVIIGLLLTALTSCNTPKATERRDIKRVAKAQGRNPHVVASACVSYYPTKDSIHESVVYKEGKPTVKKEPVYITVDCDSLKNSVVKGILTTDGSKLSRQIRIPCPPCDSFRVDTLEHYKSITQQSTALLKEQQQKYEEIQHRLTDAGQTIASQKTTIKWWMYIALIFGGYSVVRWVLRYWNIKLP